MSITDKTGPQSNSFAETLRNVIEANQRVRHDGEAMDLAAEARGFIEAAVGSELARLIGEVERASARRAVAYTHGNVDDCVQALKSSLVAEHALFKALAKRLASSNDQRAERRSVLIDARQTGLA